jgi:hypothetical protein
MNSFGSVSRVSESIYKLLRYMNWVDNEGMNVAGDGDDGDDSDDASGNCAGNNSIPIGEKNELS